MATDEPANFNVSFTLTRDDYVSFSVNKSAAEQLWPASRQRLLIFVAAVATSLLTCAMTAGVTPKALIVTAIVSLVFTVALTVHSSWSTQSLERGYVKLYERYRVARIFEPQQLTIDAESLRHEWQSQRTSATWNAVLEIGIVDDFVFLTLFGGSVIVPQRAFASEAEYRSFLAAIGHYHKAAAASTNAPAAQRALGFPVMPCRENTTDRE
jgi:hypothetical protein